jgi:predicted naringenin-chalcone synthase
MDDRNAVFVSAAPLLAEQAARAALSDWGGHASAITHIIAVSSTGTIIPGIELRLAQALGLAADVQRFGLNFLGCFGGMAALRTADALARGGGRVLVVCVELCTLHFRLSARADNMVANAIFADGAAAAVVGTVASLSVMLFSVSHITRPVCWLSHSLSLVLGVDVSGDRSSTATE